MLYERCREFDVFHDVWNCCCHCTGMRELQILQSSVLGFLIRPLSLFGLSETHVAAHSVLLQRRSQGSSTFSLLFTDGSRCTARVYVRFPHNLYVPYSTLSCRSSNTTASRGSHIVSLPGRSRSVVVPAALVVETVVVFVVVVVVIVVVLITAVAVTVAAAVAVAVE